MSNTNIPPLVILNTSRNIGVFNSNPQFPLDVLGSLRITGSSNTFRASRQSSNFSVISQFRATNVPVNNSTGLFIGKNTSNFNGFEMNYIHKGDASPSNLLSITPSGLPNRYNLCLAGSGFVGIGTSNPQFHLDSSNNIRVTSNAIVTPNRPFIRGSLNANANGNVGLTSAEATGGMTVVSANRLVAPISGLYKIGFSTILNTDTGRGDVHIILNGTTYLASTLSEDNSSGYHYRCAAVAYYMNANDYVQFNANQKNIFNGGGSYEAWRIFWMYLVG